MRLVAIAFAVLFFLGIVSGSIFYWGMGQVHPKYAHPFFPDQRPIVLLPWSFAAEIREMPEAIIWVDVYATSKDVLLVSPWLEARENLKTRDENASLQRPFLVDLLRQYPNRKFMLNILSNSININAQVLAAAKAMIERKNIAMQSEFDIVIRALKESFSDLPYGTSQSDRLRFNTFQSLAPWQGGLLPATPFRGDFYFAPLLWRKIPMMSHEIAAEIRRRQKVLILGPLENEKELQQAESLGADGFLLGNESLSKKFTTLRVAQ